MRRSASEVIRNLEMRIAQLEKSARPANVVDTVIPKMAYLHQQGFSSDYMVISVPYTLADYAESKMSYEGANFTVKSKKQGMMVEFTILSPEWLDSASALTSLQVAGFKIVSSSKTR